MTDPAPKKPTAGSVPGPEVLKHVPSIVTDEVFPRRVMSVACANKKSLIGTTGSISRPFVLKLGDADALAELVSSAATGVQEDMLNAAKSKIDEWVKSYASVKSKQPRKQICYTTTICS
eukprot:6829118-Pyramimonas_sp.AAC.1